VTPHALKRLDHELTTFVDTLTAGFGRPERRTAMAQYITGLLLDGERKSIEPIAARLVDRPDQIQAMRQRLQQCVVVSPWDAGELFDRLARLLDRDCLR
jgi:SRSO17 transposase